MNKMHGLVLIGASALLLLAACGSNSSDDAAPPAPVATTEIPASAQRDAAGLLAYANQQIGASSDTAEPVLVGDAALPLDDTTETSL